MLNRTAKNHKITKIYNYDMKTASLGTRLGMRSRTHQVGGEEGVRGRALVKRKGGLRG